MESAQLERPQERVYAHYEEQEQLPHGVVRSKVIEEEQIDDENHHHEKKSVLKKVKAKAKKIKETIKHPSHILGHDHDHDNDEESLEDDEMEDDPNVHGGHIGGSGAGVVTSTVIQQKTIDEFGHEEQHTKPNLDQTGLKNDEFGSGFKDQEEGYKLTTGGIGCVPLHRQHQHHHQQQPFASETAATNQSPGYGGIGTPVGLEEDPHAPSNSPNPASNYESKTFDPAGAGGISRVPLHHHHQQQQKPFASETTATNQSHGYGGIGAPVGLEEDPHAPSNRPNPPSNYESKTFDPTGAGGEEAGIPNLVQSFEMMNVGGDHAVKPDHSVNLEAGTTPKLHTGSHEQFAPENVGVVTEVYSSSPKDTESIPKRFDPSRPEDLPRDPIDEVTSKPGSHVGTVPSPERQEMRGEGQKKSLASATEYAKGAAMIVAEKLAPVYDKVAGVASAGMEKLPIGKGEGEGKGVTDTVKEKLTPVYDKVAAAGSSLMSKVQGPGTGQAVVKDEKGEIVDRTDKGVSIKEYLAEKLKPGEEDKALSDMISGTLSRQNNQGNESNPKPVIGKVTESEEVKRRLGSLDDRPREGSEEQGMVDLIKGAVNSWLGRDNNSETTETITETTTVTREVHNKKGERRLQESGQ